MSEACKVAIVVLSTAYRPFVSGNHELHLLWPPNNNSQEYVSLKHVIIFGTETLYKYPAQIFASIWHGALRSRSPRSSWCGCEKWWFCSGALPVVSSICPFVAVGWSLTLFIRESLEAVFFPFSLRVFDSSFWPLASFWIAFWLSDPLVVVCGPWPLFGSLPTGDVTSSEVGGKLSSGAIFGFLLYPWGWSDIVGSFSDIVGP